MSIAACITSISGPVLLAEERAFLREARPWGVILMGRSCQNRAQVSALVGEIKSAIGRDALVFIDQEGGRVARLKPPEWPRFPAAGVYGALYKTDKAAGEEACRLGHQLMGVELSDMGLHADCAPVGDLRQTTTHDAIGDRSFGYEVEAVVTLGLAALDGLSQAGVAGCIKHMPGQGRAVVDTHYDLPSIADDLSALDQDFDIFAKLATKAVMGMTGHVSYDALVPGEAATVSAQVISKVIRGRIGFDGLLMTDDLGMNALGGDLTSRGSRARAAGCDILLHCSGFLSDPAEILAEMEQIAGAAGELTDVSLARAERAEASVRPAVELDREAARQRLESLLLMAGSGV